MYCTECGFELRPDDLFCSRCGNRTAVGRSLADSARYPLLLDKQHKKIAGVCAGVARHLGVDVVLMRVLWLGIALATGIGFFAYLAAWILIPSDHGMPPERTAIMRVPQPGPVV
jgi:phage shock protein PspC (stress-responsive transcriptional regulator)